MPIVGCVDDEDEKEDEKEDEERRWFRDRVPLELTTVPHRFDPPVTMTGLCPSISIPMFFYTQTNILFDSHLSYSPLIETLVRSRPASPDDRVPSMALVVAGSQ
jgi:hypothetical protein